MKMLNLLLMLALIFVFSFLTASQVWAFPDIQGSKEDVAQVKLWLSKIDANYYSDISTITVSGKPIIRNGVEREAYASVDKDSKQRCIYSNIRLKPDSLYWIYHEIGHIRDACSRITKDNEILPEKPADDFARMVTYT